jgi:hypothetical protein
MVQRHKIVIPSSVSHAYLAYRNACKVRRACHHSTKRNIVSIYPFVTIYYVTLPIPKIYDLGLRAKPPTLLDLRHRHTKIIKRGIQSSEITNGTWLVDIGNDDIPSKLVKDPNPKHIAVPDGEGWLTVEKDESIVIIDPATSKSQI